MFEPIIHNDIEMTLAAISAHHELCVEENRNWDYTGLRIMLQDLVQHALNEEKKTE